MSGRNTKKYHLIAEELRGRIEDGTYKKELPSIRSVAEEFGVHPITARKALLNLRDDGLISNEGNRRYGIARTGGKAKFPVVGIISYSAGHLWGDMLSEMVDRLQRAGILTAIIDPSLFPEKESGISRTLTEQLVKLNPCAWVVHDSFLDDITPLLERDDELRRKTIRIIITSLPSRLHRINTSCVCIDDFRGAFMATEHLIASGHGRILLVTHARDKTRGTEPHGNCNIISGYLTALHEAGLHGKEIIHYESTDQELNEKRLRKIFSSRNRPTAIFADEDYRGIRACKILGELELTVPDDVALVGYYNTPWSTMRDLQLTSISVREKEIARSVVEFVTKKDKSLSVTNIEPELIIRDSCGCRQGTSGKHDQRQSDYI